MYNRLREEKENNKKKFIIYEQYHFKFETI